jgi:hypothetical protein
MGFSSFLCSKTGNSIPAYPYADLPAVLSHVRILFSDGSHIEGYYDGYGSVHARADFQAYCTRETQEKYHEDQKNALFYWDELEKRGLLTSDDSFEDLYAHMRIIRVIDYNSETFSELAKLEACKNQGYFYSAREINKLLESI